MSSPPNIKLPGLAIHSSSGGAAARRGRSGSLLKVETVATSNEEVLDQSAYANLNAEWVNRKGAWLIHVVLITVGKVAIDAIPGIPFQNELNAGAYDELTLWEQIDEGAQNTPSKKWLFFVPVALFLLSTHYTNYDPWLFTINLSALVFALIPKLPMAHRARLHFLPEDQSGLATPLTGSFPPSGTSTPPEGARAPPVFQVTEAQFRRK